MSSSSNYYKAYEERYKAVHQKGLLWEIDEPSKIVLDTINENHIKGKILDLGCGEGRDIRYLLDKGYDVLGIDYSTSAINKCNEITDNKYPNSFRQFDIFKDKLDDKFDFIYSIAVIHMFVLQADRDKYYKFINEHLADDGLALILSMGDGNTVRETDINEAFELGNREVKGKMVEVTKTSCKMVDWNAYQKEIESNNLQIVEKKLVEDVPGFNIMMAVLVKKK